MHCWNIKTSALPIPSPASFEHLTFKLSGPKPLVIVLPSFSHSHLFYFLTQLSSVFSHIILLGDFNLHIDNSDCKAAVDFLDILNVSSFAQQVNFPTHTHGHILDLVCFIGLNVSHLSGITISDHLVITFNIDIPVPVLKKTHVK